MLKRLAPIALVVVGAGAVPPRAAAAPPTPPPASAALPPPPAAAAPPSLLPVRLPGRYRHEDARPRAQRMVETFVYLGVLLDGEARRLGGRAERALRRSSRDRWTARAS